MATKLSKFARISQIARKAEKDLSTLSTLLYEAGVFGRDQSTIVDSLAGQRELLLARELPLPGVVGDNLTFTYDENGKCAVNEKAMGDHLAKLGQSCFG
jgi:hypothetical protein